jgi:hypothetical protein
MNIGDEIKIKVRYGHWKIGYKGIIKSKDFASHDGKIFDYGVLLDGDSRYSGFDANELYRSVTNDRPE